MTDSTKTSSRVRTAARVGFLALQVSGLCLLASVSYSGIDDPYNCCAASDECKEIDAKTVCENDTECEGEFRVCCALACNEDM